MSAVTDVRIASDTAHEQQGRLPRRRREDRPPTVLLLKSAVLPPSLPPSTPVMYVTKHLKKKKSGGVLLFPDPCLRRLGCKLHLTGGGTVSRLDRAPVERVRLTACWHLHEPRREASAPVLFPETTTTG
ncbi:hypothetical protein ANANG_G00134920 [Anguilla anguilla]|uniref:Uncharacterized protein n=1 Tax=Anguilla anguilla TaxID=7936 RepID=A0A9D3RVV3_ANGAN|nr:hypothetical protein ANANG_G00134920 [Anguilla anguilla]